MSRLAAREFHSAGPVRNGAPSLPRAWRGKLATAALLGTVAAILSAGWAFREDESLEPQRGLGYGLGIAGASMMLLVLLYPLRKRVRFMRGWARLALWFRWHMALGCVGPALVVVHARFEALSLNGFVALAATLVVATSGAIGRYLYVRIHRGLYGAKLEARELLNEAVAIRAAGGEEASPLWRGWEGRLKDLERRALTHPVSVSAALGKAAVLAASTRRAERTILSEYSDRVREAAGSGMQPADSAARAEMQGRLARYFRSLRRAGSLAVYERLFALWHVLHLPLIVLLAVTAIVHVVAVHMY